MSSKKVDNFACSGCCTIFSSKSNLQRHKETSRLLCGDASSAKSYVCEECGKDFKRKDILDGHLKRHRVRSASTSAEFFCKVCDKSFVYKESLKRHEMKTKHGPGWASKRVRILQKKCPLCSFICEELNQCNILDHFENNHNIKIEREEIYFPNLDTFQAWKLDTEVKTSSSYVIYKQSKNVTRYKCHRSGFQNKKYPDPRLKGGSQHKTKESSKIGGLCPASLKVTSVDFGVLCEYIKTHVGHEPEIDRLKMTRGERKMIAEKIVLNIPFDEILADAKESPSERVRTLKRQDLHNIRRDFNLNADLTESESMLIKLESWVENESNVVFYKCQGELKATHTSLKKEDLILIVMTTAQKDFLREHGSDMISVDNSSSSLYDHCFKLVSVLARDETSSAIPCAFMITNRINNDTLRLFYEVIKGEVGVIAPQIFMSAALRQFYREWTIVMNTPEFKCLSQRHVLKSWRKLVNYERPTKVKDSKKRSWIMTQLQALMAEQDENLFHESLDSLMEKLEADNDFKDFREYFTRKYLSNDAWVLWSAAFRAKESPDFGLKTDVYLNLLSHLNTYLKKFDTFNGVMFEFCEFVKNDLFDFILNEKERVVDPSLSDKDCESIIVTDDSAGESILVTEDFAENSMICDIPVIDESKDANLSRDFTVEISADGESIILQEIIENEDSIVKDIAMETDKQSIMSMICELCDSADQEQLTYLKEHITFLRDNAPTAKHGSWVFLPYS